MNETVKTSGATQEFNTGAHRDRPKGKGRCDLLPMKIAAMVMKNDPVMMAIGEFMEDRNPEHLVTALQESVNTVDCFHFNSIKQTLQAQAIEISINVDIDAAEGRERLLMASLAHMMLEASKLYEAGADLYGANNWQLGMPVNRYIDSGTRHYLKTLRGDIDEPHYRGFVWNLLCAVWTAYNLPELNFKEEPEKKDN